MRRIVCVFAAAAALICFSACSAVDYSELAGTYSLVGFAGSEDFGFSDFAYFELKVASSGDYSFRYKLKSPVGEAEGVAEEYSENGKFTATENVFTADGKMLSGGHSIRQKRIELKFVFGGREITALCVLTER